MPMVKPEGKCRASLKRSWAPASAIGEGQRYALKMVVFVGE
jgi:hypothetical protein